MSELRLAAEETVDGWRVCRICARRIYRALGAEDIRHRRTASTEVLMRPLLSLDYVIEHSDLPWLPTEHEKVAAFEALGIERGLLPVRVYRGAAGSTRRYFQSNCRWRSWGGAHRGLWYALQRQGRSVEIVAVVRTRKEMDRAGTILGNWAEAPAASGAVDPARCEIARMEQAIRGMDDAVIEKHGGLQGCLERIVELKDLLRSSRSGTAIDGFTTWRSSRLPGGGS